MDQTMTERVIMELVVNSGNARSLAMEAISQAKEGRLEEARVCLIIHFRHLHAPLRGIFGPNSGCVAHYAPFIWPKSPTKCDAQLAESNYQTHSRETLQASRNSILKAHKFQTELVSKEAAGETVETSLIMCHGQDHLMTAMVIIDLAAEFIDVYQQMKNQ